MQASIGNKNQIVVINTTRLLPVMIFLKDSPMPIGKVGVIFGDGQKNAGNHG
jgi:hypothetical protein